MASQSLIQQQIDKLTAYLNEYHHLINSHMVNYFTDSLFTRLPDELRNEIESIGYDATLQCLYERESTANTPHLNAFRQRARAHYLSASAICLTHAQFVEKLTRRGCHVESLPLPTRKSNAFIKAKKSHEIARLSGIVATLHHFRNGTHVIDVGDGKGYLSSALALRNQIRVLGVDSSPSNTEGAAKRAHHLCKTLRNHEPIMDNYKMVTQLVEATTDLRALIAHAFGDGADVRVTLVGLHTCGSLAAHAHKLFAAHAYVRTLCNVACCYHLLEEPRDYPLSGFLRAQNHRLGRVARMLSCQCVERLFDQRQPLKRSLFYRALLEVLVVNNRPELRGLHVGRAKQDGGRDSFADYALFALKNDACASQLERKTLDEMQARHERFEKQLYVFHLLRATLAPVIEALILLDRLLFLRENGHGEAAFLVELFDPIVSPRCYAIVAIRE